MRAATFHPRPGRSAFLSTVVILRGYLRGPPQVSGVYPNIDLGTIDLRTNGDGTAEFTAGSDLLEIVQKGDLLICADSFDGTSEGILPTAVRGISVSFVAGKVVAIDEHNMKVTLGYVPTAIGSQSYAAYISYFPRIHPPTTGKVVVWNGSWAVQDPQLGTNPGLTVEQVWLPGNRIYGQGIRPGAYVVRIDTMAGGPLRLVLSTKPRMTDSMTPFDVDALYDADMYAVIMKSLNS